MYEMGYVITYNLRIGRKISKSIFQVFQIRNQVRIIVRDIIETFDTLTTDDVTVLNSLLEVAKALVMDIVSLISPSSPTMIQSPNLIEISLPPEEIVMIQPGSRSVRTIVTSCPWTGSNDQVEVYVQTINALNNEESVDGVAVEALCEDGKSKVEIVTDANGMANLGYFTLGRRIGIKTKISGYVDSATLITVSDEKPSMIELAPNFVPTVVGDVPFLI